MRERSYKSDDVEDNRDDGQRSVFRGRRMTRLAIIEPRPAHPAWINVTYRIVHHVRVPVKRPWRDPTLPGRVLLEEPAHPRVVVPAPILIHPPHRVLSARVAHPRE